MTDSKIDSVEKMGIGTLPASWLAQDEVVESNPWAPISRIAKRLGVAPHQHESGDATIVAKGEDGQNYDVWRVAEALLDRIELVESLQDLSE